MLNQFMLWLKIVKWHVQLMKSADWNSAAHYSAMTRVLASMIPQIGG